MITLRGFHRELAGWSREEGWGNARSGAGAVDAAPTQRSTSSSTQNVILEVQEHLLQITDPSLKVER